MIPVVGVEPVPADRAIDIARNGRSGGAAAGAAGGDDAAVVAVVDVASHSSGSQTATHCARVAPLMTPQGHFEAKTHTRLCHCQTRRHQTMMTTTMRMAGLKAIP